MIEFLKANESPINIIVCFILIIGVVWLCSAAIREMNQKDGE